VWFGSVSEKKSEHQRRGDSPEEVSDMVLSPPAGIIVGEAFVLKVDLEKAGNMLVVKDQV
jgi:hypothetical protein